MSQWTETKLKTVCSRITVGHVGPMANQYREQGVPFLRSLNIAPFRIDYRDLKYIDSQFHEKLRKSKLRAGDVAVVRTGYPGTACVIPKDLGEANCSDLVVITPGLQLNAYFLTALFNSSFGRELVGGNLVGVAQQHFNVTVAKELRVRIPPRQVQDKIAAILTAYDDLIETNRRRIGLLEKIAGELYREWFVRMRFPGHRDTRFVKGVPENWEVKPISFLCKEVRSGVTKKDLADDEIYVGLEHIPRKSIVLAEWATAESIASNKLRFKGRDILFGKIRPYLHKVAIAWFSGACSSDTIVLRPSNRLFEGFLLFTLFSETFIEFATISAKGTKMPRADWAFLERLQIKLPSTDLLEVFQTRFEVVFSLVRALLKANYSLKQTRDLLLPRLMSGKLSVEDLDIEFPPSMRGEAAETAT